MFRRLLAAGLALVMCFSTAACGNAKKESAETVTTEEIVEIPNPMREVTREEMVEQTGIDLPAPDGATEVVYYVVDAEDVTISQMDFSLDGNAFTLRACSTGMTELDPVQTGEDEMDLQGFDFDMGDISGLYYEWDTMGTMLVKDRSALYKISKDGAGYIAWVDAVPGILYNLIMTENANNEILTETAEEVFVPLQGED